MGNEQVILIAGAGGSVGRTLAKAVLQRGYQAALAFRNPAHEQELQQMMQPYHTRMQLYRADLADEAEAAQLRQRVLQAFGRVDVVVNAAGGWIGGKKLHEHTAEEFRSMLDMDLRPTFHLMHQFLEVMSRQKQGKFIQFASAAVFGPGAGSAVYAASKAGVLALCRAAAEEYRNRGVSVFALAPSIIDTEKNRKAMPGADHRSWVRIEDIVRLVLYLIENGEALSGTVFHLSG